MLNKNSLLALAMALATSVIAGDVCTVYYPPNSDFTMIWKPVPDAPPASSPVAPAPTVLPGALPATSWADWSLPSAASSSEVAPASTSTAGSVAPASASSNTVWSDWLLSSASVSSDEAVAPASASSASSSSHGIVPSAPAASAENVAAASTSPTISSRPSSVPTTFISHVIPSSSSVSVTTQVASPSASAPTSAARSEVLWGVGTRYGGGCTEEDCWQKGACSFVDYELPAGIDGSTCVSDDIWDSGANCGGCISVTYKGKTLTIMVTNRTGGNATHLDMTPDTYSKLTNGLSAGGVDGIQWEWVTCPIPETTPLWIRMHGGASKYWFAATVENARDRTDKLEVSTDGGNTYQSATLEDPNLWRVEGVLSSDVATIRVTSDSGSVVVVENVALKSDQITKAASNYS